MVVGRGMDMAARLSGLDPWAQFADWADSDPLCDPSHGLALNAGKLSLLDARPPLSRSEQEHLCARITQLPGQALHELKRLIRREDALSLEHAHVAQWEFDTQRLAPALVHRIADLVERHLGSPAVGDLAALPALTPALPAPVVALAPGPRAQAADAARRASYPYAPPASGTTRPRSALADMGNGARRAVTPSPSKPYELAPVAARPASAGGAAGRARARTPVRRHSAVPAPARALLPLSSSAPAPGPPAASSADAAHATNSASSGIRANLANPANAAGSAAPRKKRSRATPAPKLARGALLETLTGIPVFAALPTPDTPANIRFMCGECGKGFRKRSEVVVHVRVHTGERPLRCRHCEQTFAHPSNRAAHERAHSGTNLFSCPVPGCAKTFKHASSLKDHALTHDGSFPYPCPHCASKFRTVSNLNKHHRACHVRRAGEHESEEDDAQLGLFDADFFAL